MAFEVYKEMKVQLEIYGKLAEAKAGTGFEGYQLYDVLNELMADINDQWDYSHLFSENAHWMDGYNLIFFSKIVVG